LGTGSTFEFLAEIALKRLDEEGAPMPRPMPLPVLLLGGGFRFNFEGPSVSNSDERNGDEGCDPGGVKEVEPEGEEGEALDVIFFKTFSGI